MSEKKSFIPTFDESHIDILVDDISKIVYLTSFSLINPGFTTEHFENKMLSFSTILAINQENVDNTIEDYTRQLQELIDFNTENGPYHVDIEMDDEDEVNVSLNIRVLDNDGNNIFDKKHVIKRLNKG
jgi:hypothetical protein